MIESLDRSVTALAMKPRKPRAFAAPYPSDRAPKAWTRPRLATLAVLGALRCRYRFTTVRLAINPARRLRFAGSYLVPSCQSAEGITRPRLATLTMPGTLRFRRRVTTAAFMAPPNPTATPSSPCGSQAASVVVAGQFRAPATVRGLVATRC